MRRLNLYDSNQFPLKPNRTYVNKITRAGGFFNTTTLHKDEDGILKGRKSFILEIITE